MLLVASNRPALNIRRRAKHLICNPNEISKYRVGV